MLTRRQKKIQNKKPKGKRRKLGNSVQIIQDDKCKNLKSQNVVTTKIAQEHKNKNEVPIEVLLDNSKEVKEIRMNEEVYKKLMAQNKNVLYYCDICTKFFESEKLQRYHYTIMHRPLTINVTKGAYCNNCRRIFEEKFYENHYPCLSTSINFKFNRNNKKIHNMTRFFDAVNARKCRICKLQLNSKKLLFEHLKSAHRPVTAKFDTKTTFCDICQKHLEDDNYVDHFPCNAVDVSCSFCLAFMPTKSHFLKHNLCCENKRSFQCNLCQLNTKEMTFFQLNDHMKTHNKYGVYRCLRCKLYLTLSTLNLHVDFYHKGCRCLSDPCQCNIYNEQYYISKIMKSCDLEPTACDTNHSTITKTTKEIKTYSSTNKAATLPESNNEELQIKIEEVEVEPSDFENTENSVEDFLNIDYPGIQQKPEVKPPKDPNRLFQCIVCGLTSRFRIVIFDHTVIHHRPWAVEMKPGIYCPRCNEWFTSDGSYSGHDPCYRFAVAANCQICYMSFPLKEHFLLHKITYLTGKRFNCTACENNSTVYNLSELNKHRKEEHNQIGVFECLKCEVSFENSLTLKRHVVKCDANDDVNLTKIYHLQRKPNSPLKYFTCNYCDKIFFSQHFLNLHENTTHLLKKKDLCFICGQAFKNVSMLKVHLNSAHYKKITYDCTKCTKKFLVKKYLIQHNKIHENTKQFKCSLCPRIFIQQTSLIYHMAHHTGENVFKCSICKRPFDKQKKLSSHMEEHNADGTNPHKCEICDKFFTHKCNLLVHMRIHTVESKE